MLAHLGIWFGFSDSLLKGRALLSLADNVRRTCAGSIAKTALLRADAQPWRDLCPGLLQSPLFLLEVGRVVEKQRAYMSAIAA